LGILTGDVGGSGTTERLTILQNGDTGLGETAPTTKLHLVTTTANGITLDRSTTADDETSLINFKYNADASWAGQIKVTKVSGGGGDLGISTGDAGGSGLTEQITGSSQMGMGE
jgi:hypothetical protein